MDESTEYIKMCEQADEIQKFKIKDGIQTFKMGDWITKKDYSTHAYDVPICLGIHDSVRQTGHGFMEGYLIWLLRQDQFHEMIKQCWFSGGIPENADVILLRTIARWEEHALRDKSVSMEKLLLIFVMKERYNKVWSKEKEEWAKEENE